MRGKKEEEEEKSSAKVEGVCVSTNYREIVKEIFCL